MLITVACDFGEHKGEVHTWCRQNTQCATEDGIMHLAVQGWQNHAVAMHAA